MWYLKEWDLPLAIQKKPFKFLHIMLFLLITVSSKGINLGIKSIFISTYLCYI